MTLTGMQSYHSKGDYTKRKAILWGWLGVELPWDTNPDCLLISGEEDGLVAEIKRL